jgi:hypothetical protein
MAAVALLLVALLPSSAMARSGSLALVNLVPGQGFEVTAAARVAMAPLVGGWARHESIAAFLDGRPNPGALPSGEVGRELAALVERVRSRQTYHRDVADLGRLLGVDYLLLLKVRGTGMSARLYSVPRAAYAPQGLEVSGHDVALLKAYVRDQTREPATQAKTSSKRRWWILGAAIALGGLTLGLSLAAKNETSGDLRVRVTR